MIFRTHSITGVIYCEMLLADLKLRERDFISATHIFQDCLNRSWGTENQVATFCLERLADRVRWPFIECAFTWPVVYFGHAQKSKEKLAFYKALLFLGNVFISQGDDETAKSLFTVALEGFTCMDVHCSRARCILHLGDLARKKGDLLLATELWTTARPLFKQSSQGNSVAQIDRRLAELHGHGKKGLDQLPKLCPPKTIFQQYSEEDKSRNEKATAGASLPSFVALSGK